MLIEKVTHTSVVTTQTLRGRQRECVAGLLAATSIATRVSASR
ncbi:MAG: hypothetical protein ACRDRN_08050 [Sciscionella sp.]